MILEIMGFLQVLANIIGAILTFLMPIVVPIGQFMVEWITVTIGFLQQNLGGDLTLFIVICVILIMSGIVVNIIWPGDKQGTIFSKGGDKIDLDDKLEKDVHLDVKRCKDCGNPIGDQDTCPLCGARN